MISMRWPVLSLPSLDSAPA
ncbi:hypothetical protein D018_3712A, partial [Vibrio parahaemolyticus VP2007-007]